MTVIELSTLGGDPEVARMMDEDFRYHSDPSPGRRFVFLGKAAKYFVGTSFIGILCAGQSFVTRGIRLMVHDAPETLDRN